MAIIYLDSAATGLADGTSWTDAYTSMQTAFDNWSSGDVIWMEKDHRETFSATQNFSLPMASEENDPVKVYRVDSTDDSYAPTVDGDTANIEITTGSGTLRLTYSNADTGVVYKGISFKSNTGQLHLNSVSRCVAVYEDCGFETSGTSAYLYSSVDGYVKVTGGHIRFAGGMVYPYKSVWTLDYVEFLGTAQTTYGLFYPTTGSPSHVILNGCDFSGITNWASADLVDSDSTTHAFNYQFNHCIIPAAATRLSNLSGMLSRSTVEFNNCDDDGVSAGKTYHTERYEQGGYVTDDTAVYLTAGFQHVEGNTNLSYKITTNSNCKEGLPIRCIPIVSRIKTTGSKTFDLEFLSEIAGGGSAPSDINDQELWFELYYLGTADSTRWSLVSTRSATAGQMIDDPDVANATNLTDTTNTANWTGEQANAKTYKLSKTVTINKEGHYMIVPYIASHEANRSVYYDGKVTVT